jgi:hypothetical protein
MSNTDSTPKRVKGSAIVSEDGDFIFTPYGTHSEDEKTLKCIAIEGDCTLWKAKNHYSIRVKIPFRRLPSLPRVAEMILRVFQFMRKDALTDLEKAESRAKKGKSRAKKCESQP